MHEIYSVSHSCIKQVSLLYDHFEIILLALQQTVFKIKKHFVHVQAIKYAKKAIGFLWCNRNDKNASGNPYFTTCLNMILPMLLYNVSCHTHMWRFCVTRKHKQTGQRLLISVLQCLCFLSKCF